MSDRRLIRIPGVELEGDRRDEFVEVAQSDGYDNSRAYLEEVVIPEYLDEREEGDSDE